MKPHQYRLLLVVNMWCLLIYLLAVNNYKETQAQPVTSVKFSVVSGLPTQMNAIFSTIPTANQIETYFYPANATGSNIQLIRKCRTANGNHPTANNVWCWNSTSNTFEIFSGYADDFDDLARNTNTIWLMSNEPDNCDESAGDNLRVHCNITPTLTPEQQAVPYGIMFGKVAIQITNKLRETNPTALPKLVFCQATTASEGSAKFCGGAYAKAKEIAQTDPNWPSGVSVADTIYAVSTHAYVWTPSYSGCFTNGVPWTNCYGFSLEANNISYYLNLWISDMNDFPDYWDDTSNIYHHGELADKPLWLTEFGALSAYCNRTLYMEPGDDIEPGDDMDLVDDEIGGIGCKAKADRSNSTWTDDYVFYGRNHNEGIWGMQYRQIDYLVHQTDWKAAWFYKSGTSLASDSQCGHTVWLFGDNRDCSNASYSQSLSRGGETYRDTLHCFLVLQSPSCPKIYGVNVVTGRFNGDNATDMVLQQNDPTYDSFLLSSNGIGGYDNYMPITTAYGGMTKNHWAEKYHTIIPGDFNGDGRTDLLLQQYYGDTANNTFLLLANSGTGPVFQNMIDVTGGSNGPLYGMNCSRWAGTAHNIIPGDFNGDGATDLLVQQRTVSTGDDSYLLLSNHSPTGPVFQNAYTLADDTNGPYGGMKKAHWAEEFHTIIPGDFNGDGRPDLLLQQKYDTHNSFLLLGNNAYTGPSDLFQNVQTITPNGNNPNDPNTTQMYGMSRKKWAGATHNIIPGDFNGDGATDLLVQQRNVSTGEDSYLLMSNDSISGPVFQNKIDVAGVGTNGPYGGMKKAHWAEQYHIIVPGDFNHDNRIDLLLQQVYDASSHNTYLLLANGAYNGTGPVFQNMINVTDDSPGHEPLYEMTRSLWAEATHNIVSGDFNGDQYIDLLVQQIAPTPYDHTDTNTVTLILYGNSSGFQNKVDVTTSYGMSGNHWAGD